MSTDMVLNLLKESLQYVALVGSSDWDPRVTANARNLMCRITSRPEMAIMDGLMWAEGGPPPVQAGGTPQDSTCATGGPYEWRSNPPPPEPFPGYRFVPKGPGMQWTIDETRSVIIQTGERGDMFVRWVNGSNQVNVRLTREAAQMTALALLHCGKNLMADCEGEPVS